MKKKFPKNKRWRLGTFKKIFYNNFVLLFLMFGFLEERYEMIKERQDTNNIKRIKNYTKLLNIYTYLKRNIIDLNHKNISEKIVHIYIYLYIYVYIYTYIHIYNIYNIYNIYIIYKHIYNVYIYMHTSFKL